MAINKYKLPYTGEEVLKKLEKVDNILYQITDPDDHPLNNTNSNETNTNEFIITMVSGTLNRDNGSFDPNDTYGLRTPDFYSIKTGDTLIFQYNEAIYGRVGVLFYTDNYTFISDWNDGRGYLYPASNTIVTCPQGASYFKAFFYCDATEGTLTYSINATPKTANRAEFKKIYIADHGYTIYGDIIDNEMMHKIVVEAEGKDNNSYNIVEIKAPTNNPEESTLALMNWGNGVKQFVDFSSMVYDPSNPTVEIVCQTRGGEPLPEFSVRYNDGMGEGRVKKFVITPDCIPMKLTSEGIEVRRNNNYDNNATDSELVTINLAELYDTVQSLKNGDNNAQNDTIKSYIQKEAERVSNIVRENRTADSFVFAALSDCHYNQNQDTQTSIENTAKALCEIEKNLSLDAIALLGDFVRGDDTDTIEDCNEMLVEIRKIFYEAIKNIPSIWTVGNHDNAHYYTKDDATDRSNGDTLYSYLGSNNCDVIVDENNRQRIYGYRDFETQKIRAIYVNTADVSDNTTTSSADVTQEQLSWLASKALNFADKGDDTSNWGVIFFSHHPLEWSSRSTKKIIDIIDDYINGEGDFIDVTSRAEIIAAFHGHTHNFIANAISVNNIPSIGIPQVCYGRYNEYAEDVDKKDKFGEFLADGTTPVYYTKARGSAQETSFNVIVIDRKNKKIYCTNYGAGRDREYNFTGSIPTFAPSFITPTIETGGIHISSGENYSGNYIRTADFIECEEQSTYMFVTNKLYWALMFYDKNKEFLDTGWDDGDSYKYLADKSYRAPEGAKYMRLFCEDTSDVSNKITIHNIS